MSPYNYRASTNEGRVVEGVMEADGEAAVVAALRSQGYIPLYVGASRPRGRATTRFNLTLPDIRAWTRGRVRGRDLMVFTRELATLLRAGMPLDRSLQSLSMLTENDRLKSVVATVLGRVQEGKSLSQALAEHPEAFPPLYVNMVRAGEAGGVIESVLERLADYLENVEKTREEVRSALTYPVILAGIGGMVVIIMLTYVLPKFTIVFADLGEAMPASTRFLMGLSEAVKSYWWMGLVLVAVAWLVFRRYVANPAGRFKYDRLKLNFPLLGDLMRKLHIARFARTLGTMVKGGVPLLQSLDIVRSIVGNSVIASALEAVQRDVSEGKGLAQPLERTGVFPALSLQMVAVGEETGRLDDMLVIVADHYDREVTHAVMRLVNMLQPVMLVLMAVVTGFIVISMLSAVFSVNQLAL